MRASFMGQPIRFRLKPLLANWTNQTLVSHIVLLGSLGWRQENEVASNAGECPFALLDDRTPTYWLSIGNTICDGASREKYTRWVAFS